MWTVLDVQSVQWHKPRILSHVDLLNESPLTHIYIIMTK